jgi:phosphatidate cytidylyltransferase
MAAEKIPTAAGKRPPGQRRTGRNLPAAIAVGVSLGTAVVATLYTVRAAFVGVVAVAIAVGVGELTRALGRIGTHPPVPPLVAGTAVMLGLAYARGADALVLGLLFTVAAVVVWRLAEPSGTDPLRDLAASAFVAAYLPFLAGFCVLMAVPPDGPRRVTAFITTVVCSDVGGYAAGVLFGRHPMAPTVSPKKTWEGFGGSVLACVLGGIVNVVLSLHGAWWQGALFGLAVVVTATLGDLGESMIKRDIGIKDMGSILPGHGGMMDRLDSLLPTAPVAWLVLSALVVTAR